MEHTKLVKEFTDGLKHFYDCIDFGGSNLDAEAIRFMNEMPGRLCESHDELVEALKENYEFTKYAGANKKNNMDEYMVDFFAKAESAQKIAKQALNSARSLH